MWNVLRRIDPNNQHIYGNLTGVIANQHGLTSASANNQLPPLQQQQQAPAQPQPAQWGAPASNAMQGVEFGGIRPYEHPHR